MTGAHISRSWPAVASVDCVSEAGLMLAVSTPGLSAYMPVDVAHSCSQMRTQAAVPPLRLLVHVHNRRVVVFLAMSRVWLVLCVWYHILPPPQHPSPFMPRSDAVLPSPCLCAHPTNPQHTFAHTPFLTPTHPSTTHTPHLQHPLQPHTTHTHTTTPECVCSP